MYLAVMISHRNLIFSTSESVSVGEEAARVYPVGCPYLAKNVRMTSRQPVAPKIPIYLAVLPWYHAMGAHAFMFRLFFSPCTVVALPHWSADLIAKTFSK